MKNQTNKYLLDTHFYQKIFNRLHDLIFIIDANGTILESNQKNTKTKFVKDYFLGKDYQKVENIIHGKLNNDRPDKAIELELKINDQRVWHFCRIGCLSDEEEKDKVYFLAFTNIQKRIQREESLIKAKEKAEAQEKIKGSFLANMSHEIRTPMNSIIGFSELMERSNNDNDKTQYLEIIKSSGQFLLNIINDIIDVSKIESGLLDIKIQRVQINELIGELVEIYRGDVRLNKEKTIIKCHKPLEKAEAVILSDKTRIRQILSNLLDNAVKFTREGEIEIGYELQEKTVKDKVPHISFYVRDTGIGIPKGEKKLIFDRYHQIREGDEAKGSGLGLTIVKALVEKLGGTLTVDSTPGKGSRFSFRIPYLQRSMGVSDSKSLQSLPEVPQLQGRHILIAEDVDANYRFVAAVMRGTKAKLTWAKNGKEAVETILKEDHVHLVLMDLRMPIMDGYKAAEHIKTLRPDVPIIALTAYAIDGDMEKALEAGCDDYLSKPIDIGQLYKKLNFYLNM